MVRYDFVDWRGRTDDCGGVIEGVGSAFIGLGRREGLSDVLRLAAIAAHDVLGDERGVEVVEELEGGVIEVACSIAGFKEECVEDACFATGSKGGEVRVVDATKEEAKVIDTTVDLDFFA